MSKRDFLSTAGMTRHELDDLLDGKAAEALDGVKEGDNSLVAGRAKCSKNKPPNYDENELAKKVVVVEVSDGGFSDD